LRGTSDASNAHDAPQLAKVAIRARFGCIAATAKKAATSKISCCHMETLTRPWMFHIGATLSSIGSEGTPRKPSKSPDFPPVWPDFPEAAAMNPGRRRPV